MAFNNVTPSKIPHVEMDEFVKLRDRFYLLTSSVLQEGATRQAVHHELTGLGIKVMKKFAGLENENKYLQKQLAAARSNLDKVERKLEITSATLHFFVNATSEVYLDPEVEDGAEDENQEIGNSAELMEEEVAEVD